ncbi:NAD(P)H-hydrate dehydratase [Thermodesulfobacteriota bacterium]
MRLVTASEMREMDSLAIEEMGIPGTVLMENAARGAARVFMDHFDPPGGSSIIMLCGRGNNGGDGYVMARYLHEREMSVRVAILGNMSSISGDALVNLEILKRINVEINEITDDEKWESFSDGIKTTDFIIDALLGTGLNSPVRGIFKRVIDDVNASGKPVMSIDIPSGLNADNGKVMGTAVKADITVTFGFAKPGLVVYPGADYTGHLALIDIGIPDAVSSRLKSEHELIGPDEFMHLLSNEKSDVHKGKRGHLLILAGSEGKTGAAALCAMGALRVGAGLVTVGVPESLNPILEKKLTEAMTVPLPETEEKSLALKAGEDILRLIDKKTVLAIGPGLSTNPETVNLVSKILKEVKVPVVLDADALNALSMVPDSLKYLDKNKVLTPHPGEMGRLTGLPVRDIQADRLETTRRYAKKWKCNLILKGAGTILSDPGGMVSINPTGNPALASGGSGDVLTGMIAGFLGRGLTPVKASQAGIYLHGMAADYLAVKAGEAGILASELSEAVPYLMKSLLAGEASIYGKYSPCNLGGIL